MKEDLAIAKTTIIQLQEENDRIRKKIGLPTQEQIEKAKKEVILTKYLLCTVIK